MVTGHVFLRALTRALPRRCAGGFDGNGRGAADTAAARCELKSTGPSKLEAMRSGVGAESVTSNVGAGRSWGGGGSGAGIGSRGGVPTTVPASGHARRVKRQRPRRAS